MDRIAELSRIFNFSREDQVYLRESSTLGTELEAKWKRKFEREIDGYIAEAVRAFEAGREFPKDVDFLDLILEHTKDVLGENIRSLDRRSPPVPDKSRLARKPRKLKPGKIPRTIGELTEMWDLWRKKRKVPPRQKANADAIKKAYLDKVQSVWERYTRQYRTGETKKPMYEIKEAIAKAAKSATARANTIIQTETTFYQNAVRVKYYDQAEDVTHYLFLAIRDHRTTPWCKTRTGLVYTKGSTYLKNERPPCHWNCRSEVLPLNPRNSNHEKIIEDKKRRRENNKPKPLPRGWGGR